MKYVKEILTEGEYEVSTFEGSKKKQFTGSDLKKIASTASKMLKAGIKIPAPFKHVQEGVFITPVEEVTDSPDPAKNAGFWERIYAKKNEHGTVSLYGVIDAPGKEEDAESPAYKVSRTVKDTSIGLLPGFKDGKGRSWGEYAVAHIALPVDPIEPDQTNFIPLPDVEAEDYEVIAMSRKMTGNVSQVLTLLKDKGISLPADTTNENFLDRLLVALMQSQKTSTSPLSQKPSTGKVESYPIMMSLTKKQVDAIVAANLHNPETNAPFTADDLKDVPSDVEQYKKAAEMMSVQLNSIYQERYKDRIASLVSSNRVSQNYADTHLLPMVNSIQMSFKNGKADENHLDLTLKALEALPVSSQENRGSVNTAQYMGRTPANASKEPNPLEDNSGDGAVDNIINAVLKSVPAGF
jgi:hypothetical protein